MVPLGSKMYLYAIKMCLFAFQNKCMMKGPTNWNIIQIIINHSISYQTDFDFIINIMLYLLYIHQQT